MCYLVDIIQKYKSLNTSTHNVFNFPRFRKISSSRTDRLLFPSDLEGEYLKTLNQFVLSIK